MKPLTAHGDFDLLAGTSGQKIKKQKGKKPFYMKRITRIIMKYSDGAKADVTVLKR